MPSWNLECRALFPSTKYKYGVATRLVAHSERVARAFAAAVLQCELLVPRDMELHPHPFKEMMLNTFYTRLGFKASRRLAFEDACPQVVAVNELLFDCDAVIFRKQLDTQDDDCTHLLNY